MLRPKQLARPESMRSIVTVIGVIAKAPCRGGETIAIGLGPPAQPVSHVAWVAILTARPSCVALRNVAASAWVIVAADSNNAAVTQTNLSMAGPSLAVRSPNVVLRRRKISTDCP